MTVNEKKQSFLKLKAGSHPAYFEEDPDKSYQKITG
jgi:hypothetical protein